MSKFYLLISGVPYRLCVSHFPSHLSLPPLSKARWSPRSPSFPHCTQVSPYHICHFPPPNVSFHRVYTHVMGRCSQYLTFVFTSLPLLEKFILTSLEDQNTNISRTYDPARGRVLSNSNNELYPSKSC